MWSEIMFYSKPEEKKVEKVISIGKIKMLKSVVVREKCHGCGTQLIVHGWNTVTNMKICDNDHCTLSHCPQGNGDNKLDNTMVDLEATATRHGKYGREELETALLIVRLNDGLFPYHDRDFDRIVNHKVSKENLNPDKVLDKEALSELKKMLSATPRSALAVMPSQEQD
jgi:hypothetical protein